jgi:hypothetical protein
MCQQANDTGDMALVHVVWNIRGDRNADDTARQPRGGVFSWADLRTPQGWRIRSDKTQTGPHRSDLPDNCFPTQLNLGARRQ